MSDQVGNQNVGFHMKQLICLYWYSRAEGTSSLQDSHSVCHTMPIDSDRILSPFMKFVQIMTVRSAKVREICLKFCILYNKNNMPPIYFIYQGY